MAEKSLFLYGFTIIFGRIAGVGVGVRAGVALTRTVEVPVIAVVLVEVPVFAVVIAVSLLEEVPVSILLFLVYGLYTAFLEFVVPVVVVVVVTLVVVAVVSIVVLTVSSGAMLPSWPVSSDGVLPVATLLPVATSLFAKEPVPEHPVLLPVAKLAGKSCTMMRDQGKREIKAKAFCLPLRKKKKVRMLTMMNNEVHHDVGIYWNLFGIYSASTVYSLPFPPMFTPSLPCLLPSGLENNWIIFL